MSLVSYLFAFIFWIFCQVSLNALSYEMKPNIEIILEQIPDGDKESLESFFRHLIQHELMGYVIFCDKPMILSALYSKPIYIDKNKSSVFFVIIHYSVIILFGKNTRIYFALIIILFVYLNQRLINSSMI